MQKKADLHVFQGVRRDVDPVKQESQYLSNSRNIRFTTRGEDTELAITPELATLKVGNNIFIGTILGTCTINNWLVIFSTDGNKDYIYRIKKTDSGLQSLILHSGNLGFDVEHPILALGLYENDNIIKVYWTDDKNQPRVINILDTKEYKDFSFDFIPELQLQESVSITPIYGKGSFHSGVLQYCITYYNKYKQESNIAYQSPLIEVTYKNRGGSPEEIVEVTNKITIDGVDTNYDYLRVYSILRTSINTTPQCKRVIDIKIDGSSIIVEDDGTIGDNIDPTELLYKNRESLVASTIEAKDGTLFLGGIKLLRNKVPNIPLNTIMTEPSGNTSSYSEDNSFYPIPDFSKGIKRTFMKDEKYFLGFQLQDKKGTWSEPVYYKNLCQMDKDFGIFKTILNMEEAKSKGYVKIRPLVSFQTNPTVIGKGVLCPTVFSTKDRLVNSPHAQSSWYIRPFYNKSPYYGNVESIWNIGDVYAIHSQLGYIPWDYSVQAKHNHTLYGGMDARAEIQGTPAEASNIEVSGIQDEDTKEKKISRYYSDTLYDEFIIQGSNIKTNGIYAVDQSIATFHSPDIDENFSFDFDNTNIEFYIDGYVSRIASAGDINVLTSTPGIDSIGNEFIKNSYTRNLSPAHLGCYTGYEDSLVDDRPNVTEIYSKGKPVKYFIYPWQGQGSLNNDCARGETGGVRTAVLKRKRESNLFIFKDATSITPKLYDITAALWNANDISMLKLGEHIYYGNVDSVITTPIKYSPFWYYDDGVTPCSGAKYTVFSILEKGAYSCDGRGEFAKLGGPFGGALDIGNVLPALRGGKTPLRIRYKSTPHIAIEFKDINLWDEYSNKYDTFYLMTGVIKRKQETKAVDDDLFKYKTWIPAGEAINIEEATTLTWEWGDCYYGRYDFIKTYPYSEEDENGIIEIGSFKTYSRLNPAARYDRNRGNKSNLDISPSNFNLINPVYNQLNNFFNYVSLDEEMYNLRNFSNSIIWSLEHHNAETVDKWTSISMASTLDLDGTKGKIISIVKHTNDLYAIQETGISKILFNSRVQIPTSDSTPIEITNGYKVDGNLYITNNIGSSNRNSVCKTPSSVYFIDTLSKELYCLSEGILNVSATKRMSSWFKELKELPKIYYDYTYNDLYIKTSADCLCFSEKFGEFSGFFDYQDADVLFNITDNFYAILNNSIYQLFIDNKYEDVLKIFDVQRNASLSFYSNSDPYLTKIFTNLEVHADWYTWSEEGGIWTKVPCLDFFGTMSVEDTYQSNKIYLKRNVAKPTNTKIKFRLWSIDIPRDSIRKLDRIRDTWCKITLNTNSPKPFVLHDLSVQYYI